MLFMTVPTAGTRPELLRNLVRDCGLPANQVIIVATRPGIELPDGVVRVDCHDIFNIQTWWSLGIEEAVRRGADLVAVSNDDVRLSPETLEELAEALRQTGATIASPGPEFLHVRSSFPYGRMLEGSLWLLDATSGLRPDPAFVWWFGDDDVDLRARRHFGGVVSVPVTHENVHSDEATSESAFLRELTDRDRATFRRKYRLTSLLTPIAFPLYRWKDSSYLTLRRLINGRAGGS